MSGGLFNAQNPVIAALAVLTGISTSLLAFGQLFSSPRRALPWATFARSLRPVLPFARQQHAVLGTYNSLVCLAFGRVWRIDADLGGDSNINEGERAIVRRAAVLITELERMEATFALCEGAHPTSRIWTRTSAPPAICDGFWSLSGYSAGPAT
jgi:hypothetical protein